MALLDDLVLKNCVRLMDVESTIKLEVVNHCFARLVRTRCSQSRISIDEKRSISLSSLQFKGNRKLLIRVRNPELPHIFSRFKKFHKLNLEVFFLSTLHQTDTCWPLDVRSLSFVTTTEETDETANNRCKLIQSLAFSLKKLSFQFTGIGVKSNGEQFFEDIVNVITGCKKLRQLCFDFNAYFGTYLGGIGNESRKLQLISQICKENKSIRCFSILCLQHDLYKLKCFLTTSECLSMIERLRYLNIGRFDKSEIAPVDLPPVIKMFSVLKQNSTFEATIFMWSYDVQKENIIDMLEFFLIPAIAAKLFVKLTFQSECFLYSYMEDYVEDAFATFSQRHDLMGKLKVSGKTVKQHEIQFLFTVV
jgi:hypothetical protein